MIVRCVKLAFVSSVLIAALGATSGASYATISPEAILSQQAYSALSSGNAAKSVSLYTQAIDSQKLKPEALANALFNRALANQTLDLNDRAVVDYTAALNMDAMGSELRARVLYNRGLAQQKLGKNALAIEDYTGALLINSSFAEAYLARGNALRESGQYLFSISDYDRALKYKHPQSARVFFCEAQAYEALKRPAKAVQLLKEAIVADASFTPAHDMLKTLSGVAESDDTQADPIATASTSINPTSDTDVAKQVLPKGVEPPQALVAVASAPVDPAADPNAEIAKPDAAAGLPAPVADAKASKPVIVNPKATNKVLVAQVPSIPPKAKPLAARVKVIKAKPVEQADVAQIETVDDNVKTASVGAVAPSVPGWVVQISSAASEDAAWSSWKTMQKTHKVLGGHKAAVVKADLGTKGTFYRVRLQGFGDQQTALSACDKLKTGGVSCFVVRI